MFLNVMRNKQERISQDTVKTRKELITIPAGQTQVVKCNVRTGPFPENQDVLFEPSSQVQLPEGLEIQEGIVHLQQGPRSITDRTAHEILLLLHTIQGQTQAVKAIYPANTTVVEMTQAEIKI